MRPLDSNKILLAVFALLAAASVGFKAAAGPPSDGLLNVRPRLVEERLESTLRDQGFTTQARARSNRSEMIFARRGDCLLAVRDARGGASFQSVFAADARPVGPVRYLYHGRTYAAPPMVAFRIGRLQNEILGRLGLRSEGYVPLAFAEAPGCGTGNFGLDSMRVAI